MIARCFQWLANVALGVLTIHAVQTVAAQQRGDEVVVIKKEVALDVPGKGAIAVEPGTLLKVRGARGNWLRVEEQNGGWIAKEAVKLSSEAENYLSQRTSEATAELSDFQALAQFRAGKQGWQAAVSVYDTALKTFPESAMVYFERGMAHSKLGKMPEAIADYEKAISLDANLAAAMNNLAWIKATGEDGIRDGAKALELATRANEITQGRDSSILDTLAAANAELGRFSDASRWQIAAIRLKERGAAADPLYLRLKLYASKQAFRAKSQ